MTPLLYVLANKPFKDHLKQLHSKWLLAEDHVLALLDNKKTQGSRTVVPVDENHGNDLS
jgi:hypothetical protein